MNMGGRPPVYDLTGEKFGYLSILGRDEQNPRKWNCLCACGGTKALTTAELRHGGRTSCGCGMGRKNHRDPFNLGRPGNLAMSTAVRSILPIPISVYLKSHVNLATGPCLLCQSVPARRLTLVYGIRSPLFPMTQNDIRNYIVVCERCWDEYRRYHRIGRTAGLPEYDATATTWLLLIRSRYATPVEESPVLNLLRPIADLYLEMRDQTLDNSGPSEGAAFEFAEKIKGAP